MAENKRARKYSRWVEIPAKVAITLVAIAFLLVLRPDLLMGGVHQYRRYVATPSLISSYLDSHNVRKLQIGSGDNNFEGWLNTEYEPKEGQAYLDATATFPLPDKSIDYLFSEHVIEHFDYWTGRDILVECYRVMRPGGKIRIVTPNLSKLVALNGELTEEQRKYIAKKMKWHDYWPATADPASLILNLELHDWGHQFVYSPELLSDSLKKAGFHDVLVRSVGESDDPNLANLEVRPGFPGEWPKRYESMAIEATR